MNEVYALSQYGWSKLRTLVSWFACAIITGLVIAGIAWQLGLPLYVLRMAMALSYLGLLTCFFIPIGMFSFSLKANLADPITGYDQWLLRLPIPTWKLAIIPAGLVTAWICAVWISTSVIVRLLNGPMLPLFSQPIAMSACAIAAYSLVWKPQRVGWHRVGLLVVSLPPLYCLAIGNLIVLETSPQWIPLASLASVVLYAASIALALYSIKLARVSTFQQVGSSVVAISKPRVSNDARHSFVNWGHALQWHDRERYRWSRRWSATLALPIAIFIMSILPLNAGTAVFLFLALAGMTMPLVGTLAEPSVHGIQSSLPSYLLASPSRAHSMAWIRIRGHAIEYCRLVLLTALLL